jgi:hypothetical protein
MEATWMVELLQLIKLSLKDQVEMMMIVTENVVVTHVIAIVAEIMEVVEGLMVVNAFSVANLVILQGNVLVKEEKEGYGGRESRYSGGYVYLFLVLYNEVTIF